MKEKMCFKHSKERERKYKGAIFGSVCVYKIDKLFCRYFHFLLKEFTTQSVKQNEKSIDMTGCNIVIPKNVL